jgi:lipoyl(octanoyl) transferase
VEAASPPLQPTVSQTNTIDWGRTRHADAWKRQQELVARRLAGEIGDTLVFTEHEPVFTVGLRRGAERNLVWDEAARAAAGVELVETNRGGDVTYHGPGQVVGYPIVDWSRVRDLHAYLRFLEQVLINSLGCLGLAAGRREGKTGIWLGTRKIAAIGVAVRRWVTYHGFALNVSNDLTPFAGIIPCGIAQTEGTVTSLERELNKPVALAEVREVIAREFWALLPKLRGATPPAVVSFPNIQGGKGRELTPLQEVGRGRNRKGDDNFGLKAPLGPIHPPASVGPISPGGPVSPGGPIHPTLIPAEVSSRPEVLGSTRPARATQLFHGAAGEFAL